MVSEPILVQKRSGEHEPFSEEKVRSSLHRAGADEELIDKIVDHVKSKLYDGITTKEIYAHVFARLRELRSPVVSKYDLKGAILELGPSGFPFERFVAGILQAHGYEVAVGRIIQGKCVDHEIDVIAQKDDQHFMIEAKFHNLPGMKSDIRDALYTYARFLDVQEAWVEIAGHRRHLHQAWLVTNTKLTSKVKEYAQCVGLKVISWDYPPEGSLRSLIEESGLIPVTCLTSLGDDDKRALVDAGFLFARDLLEQEIDFLPRRIRQRAGREAAAVCESQARHSRR
jgi:Holliday junction resolvase